MKLFPTLNAYSASALLSTISLKHLIVASYEELAPILLGNGQEPSPARGHAVGAVRGSIDALCLRDFCEAVRFEGGRSDGEGMDEQDDIEEGDGSSSDGVIGNSDRKVR